ncbi:Hypothetical protein I5071_10660 [Sandaracinus amylolyticus]|nr:Hypothetical protein I5071_10660 [Sandaracinus amylolyticus]
MERSEHGLRITLRYATRRDPGTGLIAIAAAIGGAVATPSIGALGVAIAIGALAALVWTVVRARRVAIITLDDELRAEAPWAAAFEPIRVIDLARVEADEDVGLGHRVIAIRRETASPRFPVVPYHRARSAVADVTRLLADRLAFVQQSRVAPPAVPAPARAPSAAPAAVVAAPAIAAVMPAPAVAVTRAAAAATPAPTVTTPAASAPATSAPTQPEPVPPGGLERLGPALRAMIDRGLAVEVSTQRAHEWITHVCFRPTAHGRYERSVSATSNDGSGFGGVPEGTSFVDAPQVERELEEGDAVVVVLDRDHAFVARCSRCAPLAQALGARPDRVYANGGVYLRASAWSELARAWGAEPEGALLRCPECGRHAEREARWRWQRAVFVAAREDSPS